MQNKTELYDFRALGKAIKDARRSRGWTRDRLSNETGLAPRYIVSIENEGQHPSLQVFYELVTLLNISVDQFFFPEQKTEKSTERRQLEALLEDMNSQDLKILTATARGIWDAKECEEKEEREES